MKLDLISIRKLSPVGLWDLAELVALIATVQRAVGLGIGTAVDVRRYARIVAQYRRDLREKTLDNFNMRVKAWVMQCPERIAHVRGVIGEVTIKRWNQNRLLDYAFTRAFGDWKSAFPDGLGGGVNNKDEKPRQYTRRKLWNTVRAYTWKPFALVKIPNAVRILYGQPALNPTNVTETEDQRAAYLKLWGVDIADTTGSESGTQPRQSRAVNLVRFTPYELVAEVATGELVAEAATGMSEERVEEAQTPKLTNAEPEIFPPPKSGVKRKSLLQENITPPQEDKPP